VRWREAAPVGRLPGLRGGRTALIAHTQLAGLSLRTGCQRAACSRPRGCGQSRHQRSTTQKLSPPLGGAETPASEGRSNEVTVADSAVGPTGWSPAILPQVCSPRQDQGQCPSHAARNHQRAGRLNATECKPAAATRQSLIVRPADPKVGGGLVLRRPAPKDGWSDQVISPAPRAPPTSLTYGPTINEENINMEQSARRLAARPWFAASANRAAQYAAPGCDRIQAQHTRAAQTAFSARQGPFA
jgi:hypothetical protein